MRVYRKLLPTEARLFQDHLCRLSPDDRVSRFAGSVSDAVIVDYARRFDWLTGILIGCFVDGALRGVAELRRLGPGLGWRAELAVTVEELWQDNNIGTELLRRSIGHARNRGLKTLYMICLTDNRRMQAMARKFEGDLVFDGSQVEADITLPFPTQLTLLAEAMGDGVAFAASWWEQIARAAEPKSGQPPA
jgi:RimJ/RimL family protein N-acetyltransferase